VVTVAARVSVSPGATFVEAVEDVPIDTIGAPPEVGVAVSGMLGGVAVLAGVLDGGIMTTVVSEYGGMLCAKALPMPKTDLAEMVLLCMPYE